MIKLQELRRNISAIFTLFYWELLFQYSLVWLTSIQDMLCCCISSILSFTIAQSLDSNFKDCRWFIYLDIHRDQIQTSRTWFMYLDIHRDQIQTSRTWVHISKYLQRLDSHFKDCRWVIYLDIYRNQIQTSRTWFINLDIHRDQIQTTRTKDGSYMQIILENRFKLQEFQIINISRYLQRLYLNYKDMGLYIQNLDIYRDQIQTTRTVECKMVLIFRYLQKLDFRRVYFIYLLQQNRYL